LPASSNTSSNWNGGGEISIALLLSAVFERTLTYMQKKGKCITSSWEKKRLKYDKKDASLMC
jgi:hypothetical protein